MTVVIKDKNLIISIPMVEKLSGSGKSLVIASSNGNQPTELKFKGKTVVVGVNAYVKAD